MAIGPRRFLAKIKELTKERLARPIPKLVGFGEGDTRPPAPSTAPRGVETVIPEHVLQFVRRFIKSVWTLDLLVHMRREPARSWTVDILARELRGNRPLVEDALASLTRAGLLKQDANGAYRYEPAADLDAIAAELERHYAERPVALIKAIASAPSDKIQSFADAFRIKKD